MKVLSSSDDDIIQAAAVLRNGGLVAFPTETVYGLGGDAFNAQALAKIFAAKNRPFFDPLIIHIAEISALDRLVLWEALGTKAARKFESLAKAFWPGPLTLVLPKRPELPDLANAGLPCAAIRFPSSGIAQKLIRASTGTVAAPSANPFGCLSPTRAEHVVSQLDGRVEFVIDGGRTGLGLESTVLDISVEPARLLRPGGISREQIEALVGPVEMPGRPKTGAVPVSPGQLKSHYAPRTPLYLYRSNELAGLPLSPREGHLYFSAPREGTVDNERVKVLSSEGDPVEAAANFFDMLHELDKMGLALIRAEEAPPQGLGEAINDRLRRAAIQRG